MAARIHSVDPRAERVRAKLRDAAFAMAHERPVDQLTVSDIVHRAGVSRQAFYQHFLDRDDAIAYAFAVAFASATANVDEDPRTRIVALFDFAAEHRAMYRNVVPSVVTLRVLAAFRAELEPACEQIAAEARSVDGGDLPRGSVAGFLVGGFVEVLRSWMDDDEATDLHGRVTAALDTVEVLLGLSAPAHP